MPRLTPVQRRQIAIGFGAAAVLVVVLFGLNIAGLRQMVLQTADGPLALAVLWLCGGIVLALVQGHRDAAARDRDDDDDPPDEGGRRRVRIPVRVRR